jgi:serine/threonine-protein kinase
VAIHPGDILAGYRVTRLLGRGGMGEVWAAVSDPDDRGERREVAIKILLARAAMKPDLVRRFEREAQIASAIQSPYVCQLIESGTAADGAHLLVFEKLAGESLADRLKREQYLPFSEVGPIIDDVLQGLAAAHAAGVVHRDLKPGNIFLHQLPPDTAYAPPSGGFGALPAPPPPRRERAKILDFGISKLTRRRKDEPTLTAFDATLGSFAYMAPEQVRGAARADERADIYAVGAVAFRALSGRLPFEGQTAAVLVAMKLDRQAPSLAEATGDVWPAGIERFLERALERRREDRYASADEALAAWRSVQPANIARGPDSATLPDSGPLGLSSHSAPRGMDEAAGPASKPKSSRRPAALPPRAAAEIPPARVTRPVATTLPSFPQRAKTPIPPPTKPIVQAVRIPPPPVPVVPFPTGSIATGSFATGSIATGSIVTSHVVPPVEPVVTPKPGSVRVPPPPRPPIPSYQVIEDNPTEVDGPPVMTLDTGAFRPGSLPPEDAEPQENPTLQIRRKTTGRP